MNNSEFYNTIRLISKHQNTIALIDIKEFRKLKKLNGEYLWQPFEIGNLPAIPIQTVGFEERFKATNEMVKIKFAPIWAFLTNQKRIITPNIEVFEFTEHSKYKPHYTLFRKAISNPHYLTSGTLDMLLEKPIAKEENAIEWNKKSSSTLLVPADEPLLKAFLTKYQSELEEFDTLYEESADVVKQLSYYQKILK